MPRGELLIAANEATCIYVLPLVFSEFKKQFPNVQILVDRSYGARVVEAVLDNQADFGITQLPVAEKRLQVVKIHSDEIKALMPASHPLARRRADSAQRSGRVSVADAEDRAPRGGACPRGSSRWKTTLTLPWSWIPPR